MASDTLQSVDTILYHSQRSTTISLKTTRSTQMHSVQSSHNFRPTLLVPLSSPPAHSTELGKLMLVKALQSLSLRIGTWENRFVHCTKGAYLPKQRGNSIHLLMDPLTFLPKIEFRPEFLVIWQPCAAHLSFPNL